MLVLLRHWHVARIEEQAAGRTVIVGASSVPSFGYSLMCELYGSNELLAQAARAEEAGFNRIAIVALGSTDRFFELWEQELRARLESIAV